MANARALLSELRRRHVIRTVVRLVASMTKSPEAYDAFLQGRRLAQLDIEAQWEARKRAVELDPSSVAAMHEFGQPRTARDYMLSY